MIERLRELAAIYTDAGVRVGLETGQEDAETLLGVLDQIEGRGVGVNFDPANMLLYGVGDPIEALRELAPRVVQVHIKDATPSPEPGVWGEEVPAGKGAVDWDAFFDVVRDRLAAIDLMIEREAGENRVGDIRAARELAAIHRTRRGLI
jgi:sugar phosphate isomerase/epimerase